MTHDVCQFQQRNTKLIEPRTQKQIVTALKRNYSGLLNKSDYFIIDQIAFQTVALEKAEIDINENGYLIESKGERGHDTQKANTAIRIRDQASREISKLTKLLLDELSKRRNETLKEKELKLKSNEIEMASGVNFNELVKRMNNSDTNQH